MKTIEVYVVLRDHFDTASSILGYAKGEQKDIMEYFKDQQETVELENGPIEVVFLESVKVRYFSNGQAYKVQLGRFIVDTAVGKPEEIRQYFNENCHLIPMQILNITPKAVKEKHELIRKKHKLNRKKAKLEQQLRQQKKKLETLEEKLSN